MGLHCIAPFHNYPHCIDRNEILLNKGMTCICVSFSTVFQSDQDNE